LGAGHVGCAIGAVGEVAVETRNGYRLKIGAVMAVDVRENINPGTDETGADQIQLKIRLTCNTRLHVKTRSAELRTTDGLVVVHACGALVLCETLSTVDGGAVDVRDGLGYGKGYFEENIGG
jgi:hypothetical protein